jgi:peptidyl-prolyl cis-trans isomerase SurA
MVALCEKKATTVDSPKKRKIREEMFTEKYEAKQKAYLADIRKAAMIECR